MIVYLISIDRRDNLSLYAFLLFSIDLDRIFTMTIEEFYRQK